MHWIRSGFAACAMSAVLWMPSAHAADLPDAPPAPSAPPVPPAPEVPAAPEVPPAPIPPMPSVPDVPGTGEVPAVPPVPQPPVQAPDVPPSVQAPPVPLSQNDLGCAMTGLPVNPVGCVQASAAPGGGSTGSNGYGAAAGGNGSNFGVAAEHFGSDVKLPRTGPEFPAAIGLGFLAAAAAVAKRWVLAR